MQKLKQFPHFEYHHINLFYNFIEVENYQIANENIEIVRKLNKIYQTEDLEGINELFDEMSKNYENLYNNVLLKMRNVKDDLQKQIE